MLNTRFEEYKLKRELKRNGTEVTFYRNKKNAFGEHVGELEVVAKLTGLYHETNGYVSLSVSDATVQRSVKLPMLLCLNDDVKAAGLVAGDYVKLPNATSFSTKTYYITGMVDISDFGIITDISLEVIDDGTSS